MGPKKTTTDNLVTAIIEARLNGIAMEMGLRIMKGAYSIATASFRDLGAQVFDAKKRLLSQCSWLPVDTAGSHIALQGIINHIGLDNIHQGDFIVGNDPYIVRAGHLPDWSFILPIFYKDELAFCLYARTHMWDNGGAHMLSYWPNAFDIHAEGFILPPTKLYDRENINEDVFQVILANVRGREMMRADCQMIRGSMQIAESRLRELISNYGIGTVQAAIDNFINATEKSIRSIIRQWPDGVYKSRSASDSDGTSPEPVWVNLTLTIDSNKGHLTFDYTDNQPQVDFVNANTGIMYAGTITPVRWSLPPDIHPNQGLINCITIKTKPGTICDVAYPGTIGGNAAAIGNEVVECVQMALAQAIPKEVPAAWTRHQSPCFVGKAPQIIDPRTGKRAYYQTFGHFAADGSCGAMWGYDGWDALMHGFASGAITRESIEISEHNAPWLFLECEWWQDSAGDGQFRGGIGSRATRLNLHPQEGFRPGDIEVQTGTCNNEKFLPFGLLEGRDGKPSIYWIERKGELIPLHTMSMVQLEPGDAVISRVGGGGGVGDPLNRELEKVSKDALREYISIENAMEAYGVVIDPVTFEVNNEATAQVRARKKSEKAREAGSTTNTTPQLTLVEKVHDLMEWPDITQSTRLVQKFRKFTEGK